MQAKQLLLSLSLCCAATAQAQMHRERPSSEAQALQQSSLSFIENKGQITDQHGNPRHDINFRIGGSGLNLFTGSGKLRYQWAAPTAEPDSEGNQRFALYRMDVTLVGANPQAKPVAEQKQPFYERYYTPQFGEQGATAYAYQKITYKEVYPHIDWVLYVKGDQVEYDFVVRPGGKVSDIKLKYSGATHLAIDPEGRLSATTPMGTVTEHAPVSFQEDGKPVASRFVLQGDVLSFSTAPHTGTLTIDPTLSWSTYYGGAGVETIPINCITGDGYDNRYFAAHTTSNANIATTGSFQDTLNGPADAFLIKFNSAGIRQWATYYGGITSETQFGLAYDQSGAIYLTGYTSSPGMATSGGYQTTSGGGQDVFLAKFDTSGIRVWSTYYGGTGSDRGYAVTTDAVGNVFLAGTTTSATGIATGGALNTTLAGGTDAFLVKFDSAGMRQWATYYGGTALDQVQGIACDDSTNIYMAGYTLSTTNIASPGSYQSSFAGAQDGFLVKFDSSGNLAWGTYYGGTAGDVLSSVTCDGSGNVYIAGTTISSSGISTAGSYQPVYTGGVGGDAFVARFSKTGSLQWGTYFGGSGSETANALTKNQSGAIYLTGATTSTSGIATPGTFQDTLGGVQDAFVVKFDTSGSRIWATYFGGELGDIGFGIFCNTLSYLFIAGSTKSLTGIANAGSHQPTYGGGTLDAFIADFNDCSLTAPTSISGSDTVCRNVPYTYTVPPVAGATSYTWITPAGWSGAGTTNSITVTPAGNSDTIKVTANFACGSSTMTVKPVVVSPLPLLSPSGTIGICNGDSAILTTPSGIAYTWLKNGAVIPGATTSNLVVTTSGMYAVVVVNSFGCSDTSAVDTVVVHPNPLPVITASGTLLSTGSYTNYQWSYNGTPITGATSASYNVTITTGNYTVTVTDTNGCSGTSAAFDASTLGTNDVDGEKTLVTVYPNPAGNYLFISSREPLSLTICSIEGRVLRHYEYADKIDIGSLANGVYLLHFFDKNGLPLCTQKIIKQTSR